MIIGNMKYYDSYLQAHKEFKPAFDLIQKLLNFAEEKTAVEQSGLRCTVWSTPTSDFDQNGTPKLSEEHHKVIDIHFILDGEEDFGYGTTEWLIPEGKYQEEKDVRFYRGELSRVTLRRGDFVIVYPEDAHCGTLNAGSDATVKRGVIKITL